MLDCLWQTHCFIVYDKYVEALERDRKVDNFYNNCNSETEVFGLAVNLQDIWCLKTFTLTKCKLFIHKHLKKITYDKMCANHGASSQIKITIRDFFSDTIIS